MNIIDEGCEENKQFSKDLSEFLLNHPNPNIHYQILSLMRIGFAMCIAMQATKESLKSFSESMIEDCWEKYLKMKEGEE